VSPLFTRIALAAVFTISLVFGLIYALGPNSGSTAYELRVVKPGHIQVTYPKNSLVTSRRGEFLSDADGDGYPDLWLSYVEGSGPQGAAGPLDQYRQVNHMHSGRTGDRIFSKSRQLEKRSKYKSSQLAGLREATTVAKRAAQIRWTLDSAWEVFEMIDEDFAR